MFTELVGLTIIPNEHVAPQELNHHSDDDFLPLAFKKTLAIKQSQTPVVWIQSTFTSGVWHAAEFKS